MTATALILVLASAGAHATWNLLFKQAAGGVALVWLSALAAVACYSPVVAVDLALGHGSVDATLVGFAGVSGVIHAVYFLVLQRAYRVGDLSFVYPLSRGAGALLTVVVAIALLGERPSAVGLVGIAIIVGAILVLAWPANGADPRVTLLALATAATIAAYTLWDKQAVDDLDRSPIVFFWALTFVQMLVLGAIVAARRQDVAAVWRRTRRSILAFGFLAPASYILMLFALALSPASYVGPAREVSVLLGALLGGAVLNEQDAAKRTALAGALVAGIVALALG